MIVCYFNTSINPAVIFKSFTLVWGLAILEEYTIVEFGFPYLECINLFFESYGIFEV